MDFDFDSLFDSHAKQQLKKISSQVAGLLYNEFYLYIWFICIYSVFLLVLTITNLGILIHLYLYMQKLHSNLKERVVWGWGGDGCGGGGGARLFPPSSTYIHKYHKD